MEIKADEISRIIEQKISGLKGRSTFRKQVLLSPLATVSQGFTVLKTRWPESCLSSLRITGMVLNLEEDNIGAVVFGEDYKIKEGDIIVKDRKNCWEFQWVRQLSAGLSMPLAIPSTARDPLKQRVQER